MRVIIAIDPGKNGGIAWRDTGGVFHCAKMPDTERDIADKIASLIPSQEVYDADLRMYSTQRAHDPICFIEKVGFHRVGNSASSSVKFGTHVGFLRGVLTCFHIPFEEVAPQKWMKSLGALPKDVRQRKNRIKEIAQQRYPSLGAKITLHTADAIAILGWAEANLGASALPQGRATRRVEEAEEE